jgi:hypothetical protein
LDFDWMLFVWGKTDHYNIQTTKSGEEITCRQYEGRKASSRSESPSQAWVAGSVAAGKIL